MGNDLSIQYPGAPETLVLQAAEELLYGGVVVFTTRRALEASKRPLDLNDTLTAVPDGWLKVPDNHLLSITPELHIHLRKIAA